MSLLASILRQVRSQEHVSREDVKEAFRSLDKDSDGFISAGDLRLALGGQGWRDEEAEELVSRAADFISCEAFMGMVAAAEQGEKTGGQTVSCGEYILVKRFPCLSRVMKHYASDRLIGFIVFL